MFKKMVLSIFNGKQGRKILERAERDSKIFIARGDIDDLGRFLDALDGHLFFLKGENRERLLKVINDTEEAFVNSLIKEENDDDIIHAISSLKERERMYTGSYLERHKELTAKLRESLITKQHWVV